MPDPPRSFHESRTYDRTRGHVAMSDWTVAPILPIDALARWLAKVCGSAGRRRRRLADLRGQAAHRHESKSPRVAAGEAATARSSTASVTSCRKIAYYRITV